jgi:hypothetical protein
MLKSFVLLFCFAFTFLSCSDKKTLFKQLSSAKTGIGFNNEIIETDSINVIKFENVYNGGGVAAGDFNNDGLQDLFFTGNLVECKLYLNKGNLTFKDVTKEAGTTGNGKWCRGVASVDINNDGWLDIYVCATLKKTPGERKNLFYINQGLNQNSVPVFKELAEEYGVADTSHSTMAAFFDYDNDGDLDLYIAVNDIVENDFPNRFRTIIKDGTHSNTDRLYRNDWNDSLDHPLFTNVSKEAGILWEGYAHGLNICDINRDGWKDIYVSNDYLSGNLLYINNKNGTFTNKVFEYFKHGAANAMGNDVIDVNNDGLSDVIELDMNPEDNYRKKMMMNPNSYQTYQNLDYFGYHYQYVRNCLQINMGSRVNANDSVGDPVFAELAWFSGIAETDWSWAPSVADFDNDGNRDIIISNGFPKDVTDHDFIAYRNEAFMIASTRQLLDQIPEVKIQNYAFRNNGNLTFSDVTKEWGLQIPSFSNGAVYTDLDNDGDLDYVANNINDEAFVFENTANSPEKINSNFLRIKLKGDENNIKGLGAWVEIYYDQKKLIVYENSPYRGYLSTVDDVIHFGLGKATTIDSLVIKWPDGKKQIIINETANKTIVADKKNADGIYHWQQTVTAEKALFSNVTRLLNVKYKHEEKDFIDFNIQKLLPHKLSQYGPALATGDVNGDGLDDLFAGGSKNNSGIFMLQQKNGTFTEKPVLSKGEEIVYKSGEDMGVLLFDADNDGDLDLYCASGTYENLPNTSSHRDDFFINDGRGNFRRDTTVFPLNYTSKSCIRAADYDKDGDLDLFIGGRVLPGSYPKPVSSFIYRNDSKSGQVRFTDVTSSVAKDLLNIGLVCDALWTDYDNDGWIDLMLAGEWMPVTVLKNTNGSLQKTDCGLLTETGWWNSLAGGDFDNDGDIDYIAGNLGLNSFYKSSEKYPVKVYAKDFDNNGNYDAVPSLFLSDVVGGTKKEFPALTRDDMVKQMIFFRSKFPSYQPFAKATFEEMFTKEEMKGALVLHANNFNSVFIKNIGNGRLVMHALPIQAQWAPLNAMLTDDFDNDGNLDVLVNSNDYGTEVSTGRYDAMNGLLLKGDGSGNFTPLKITESGIFIPGDGKALVKLRGAENKYLVAASQNRDYLRIFEAKLPAEISVLKNDDIAVIYRLKNGKTRKEELYYGSSFLSQSSRFIRIGGEVESVDIINSKNQKRTVTP